MSKKSIRIYFNERKQRFSLTLLFAFVVFIVLLAAILLAMGLVTLLIKLDVFGGSAEEIKLTHILLAMAGISLLLGSVIVVLLGKIPLKPINKLVNGMNSLAAGNYKTRIDFGEPIGNHSTFKEIERSFNTLACELESTEVLRSDFINNFSHEFKTPIVSMAGFAKLLKKGNLTEEQKKQYLDAIEEESMRLSYMATNILNMNKIDTQNILTDVTEFNISEQVRSSVLLMEGKWLKKDIELELDFDEYTVEANEELLKQVWINLVDNAVKFSDQGGVVSLDVGEEDGMIRVSISNGGKTIPQDKISKIFGKFYQADESHSNDGNGIGLAIVKKVVELHGGLIDVSSTDTKTTFTVTLPKKQS